MKPEWITDATKRLAVSEGLRLNRYFDSLGIPTIGIGYNLTRGTDPLVLCSISNPAAVVAGNAGITEGQAYCLLANDLAFAVSDARASLRQGIFDAMSDARQFAVTDFCYNMGLATWLSFITARSLIEQAQKQKTAGSSDAHTSFVAAGNDLEKSAYYTQTGDRAKRNVAMIVTGEYCNPEGNGSDIYQGA